jgi:putative phosphoesterase
MLIAIIADIHDNLENLMKFLSWCRENKADELICCGDVTNSETLGVLSKEFEGKIHLVSGNMEIFQKQEVEQYNNIKYYGRTGIFEIDGQTIGICHEPEFIDKILEQNDCKIIFYGHTHKPWMSSKKHKERFVMLANPGTLGGVLQRATFATMEGEKLELKILDQI